jgi:hypothetical protein
MGAYLGAWLRDRTIPLAPYVIVIVTLYDGCRARPEQTTALDEVTSSMCILVVACLDDLAACQQHAPLS